MIRFIIATAMVTFGTGMLPHNFNKSVAAGIVAFIQGMMGTSWTIAHRYDIVAGITVMFWAVAICGVVVMFNGFRQNCKAS